jgi:lipopolysaccharide transport system permease protein
MDEIKISSSQRAGGIQTHALQTSDKQHATTLSELFCSFLRNRQLIFQMARREVIGRYRGSVMGLAWSFFNPILMLVIYTFVFSTVFKARWGVGGEESQVDFAIVLFVGMIVHGLFAECVNRAPQLIIGNTSYVKKVVFPLETLPWVAMGSALFHTAISLAVLLIVQLILAAWLPWTALLFPMVLLPLIFATIGFAWFLAATGVYVRDIGQTTGIFTTVLLFVSPVFYPISVLPEKFQLVLMLNPLTFIIEQARQVLIWGRLPDWTGLGLYSLASLVIAWAGFWWFQKTRRGFADVL